MKLYIKNMMSNRCKMVVREEMKKLELHFIIVDLGEVDIMEDISAIQRQQLKINLLLSGLELMDDNRAILIEKIKKIIFEMVRNTDNVPKIKFSIYLSEKLHHDYTYLSNLFSSIQGTSIQHFIMLHKVELIKELMFYDELNITEIAYKLNYSSVAHLSNQFKKITGISPANFKQLNDKKRIPIEEIGTPIALKRRKALPYFDNSKLQQTAVCLAYKSIAKADRRLFRLFTKTQSTLNCSEPCLPFVPDLLSIK